MPKAASLSKRTRFAIFERDSFTCQYCGNCPPDAVLELDHIHPRSKGGKDVEENLITSCWDCNQGKSNRVLGETRKVYPNNDAKLLKVQQEILETRKYLEAKAELDQLNDLVLKGIKSTWMECSPKPMPFPKRHVILKWIDDFGASEVETSIVIAGTIAERKRFDTPGYISYIHGILRNRKQLEVA